MENLILVDHINVSKKSPTAEEILNHVSKTLASDIDLSFVNEIIKQPIAKNKIIISKLLRKPKTEILITPMMKYNFNVMSNQKKR